MVETILAEGRQLVNSDEENVAVVVLLHRYLVKPLLHHHIED